ncbi:Rossmann-like and DUF2520 domain-containing protein [Flavobacterium psychrotrophum]|uniref:Rossmann-like and DUF2520 domain-containing protein n=1 Tax=Flavobacterium psychrotrophum TaxID=2294119 RepID=UPI000E3199FF|nr:F420-dependent NADP oxidoreductase [Flavobacterium psychrotrophum]
MLSVIILGSGNVAQHLIKAFSAAADVNLVKAYARHPEKLSHLLPPEKITNVISNLADADVYIISVSDDAIAAVSAELQFKGKLVVHTSGSTPLEILDNKNRRGVFYPLQTFSAAKAIDFSTVPLCLESEFSQDLQTLHTLAQAISKSFYHIDSKQRQALHVAAVFVSNFVNHMYVLGSEVCAQNNIPFDILKPLIKEVADKATSLPPLQAQTGPALRGDEKTISRHLDFLQDEKLKEIYTLLTYSIQQTHEQKL